MSKSVHVIQSTIIVPYCLNSFKYSHYTIQCLFIIFLSDINKRQQRRAIVCNVFVYLINDVIALNVDANF